MRNHHAFAFVCALGLLASGTAQAHFVWFVTQPGGKTQTAEVYFSETAAPDDPALLARVAKAEAWALGGRRGNEPQPLKLSREGDSLTATLPAELHDAPVVLRHTYGAMTRGGESFLLKYYAKGYALPLAGAWRAVNDPELLPLEVAPIAEGADLVLKVLWQGKPQAGAVVTVEGPGIEKKLEGTTDDSGRFRCRPTEPGLFSIRAKFVEEKSGDYDGTAYASIRHYSTLALHYAPAQVTSVAHQWPALSRGVTSFGGAVAGDALYVYGGHYGGAHEYDREGQSGDFYRLSLRGGGAWEQLPGGPKLTGLAMVEYAGKLYRVGGFTARNAAGESEDLWSQPDVSRFDPQTRQWETLPALPEGRSSHDAAVLGKTLYVVGGWEMKGNKEDQQQQDKLRGWHDTAWSADLSTPKFEWKPIATPPFHRRAVSLAAWQGKLYCLGGMQEQGGPTTKVAIYDPAKNEWSEGPALIGSGLEGFGTSSFACQDKLFASTMSGSVQRLAPSGDRWECVGQLQHPRFFHRLLPWNDNLVIVGGASMRTGKTLSLEMIPLSRPNVALGVGQK
jgi:N-acetylneuraminic acid mutarotase